MGDHGVELGYTESGAVEGELFLDDAVLSHRNKPVNSVKAGVVDSVDSQSHIPRGVISAGSRNGRVSFLNPSLRRRLASLRAWQ